MRIVVLLLLDAAVNLGILAVSYPIWEEFQYQRYSSGYWWGVYIWAAVLSTASVSFVALVVYAALKGQSRNVLMFSEMFFSFLVLSVISVVGGMSEPNAPTWYPLGDIDAKFFAELQILRFIPLSATSMGAVAGLFFRLATRKRAERS